MNIRLAFCITLLGLFLAGPVIAATTQVHVVKYANDNTTILAEETVNYSWMAANLEVLGDGTIHYYHQGPVFLDDVTNETHEQELRLNPEEDTNVLEKDMGAVKGTNVRDLCDLVGGMSNGDLLKVKSSDGFYKWFAYRNVYLYSSREGPIGLTWYLDGKYPDTGYIEGLRLVWFADNSVNKLGSGGTGVHAFGNYDWHEAAEPEYWYYFQQGEEQYPTTTGLSVKSVSDLIIYSTQSPGITPNSAFTSDIQTGMAPLRVRFIDQSTGTGPLTYAWDFNNDGTVDSTVVNPTYTYVAAGTYSVNLTVTNTAGSDSLVRSGYISVTTTNTTVFFNPPNEFVETGETANMTLYANIFPAGLAGFNISVSLANPQSGKIVGVTFPPWATLNSHSSDMPADTIWFSGVDVNRLVEHGATNVTLGTLLIRGDNPGTTDLIVEVIQMDADGGAIITPTVMNGNLAVEGSLTANFSADTTSGQAPLPVHFTDLSIGDEISAWAWDFDYDGDIDSTQQNPQFTYNSQGSYSVNLTVTNSAGSNSRLKANFITVVEVPEVPVADFTGIPTSGQAPLTVQFTDASSGIPTAWAWDFDYDGDIDSTTQNPQFTYNYPGSYSVNLTVMNSAGSNSRLKAEFITVSEVPEVPVADFTGTPTSGQAPLTVQFTDASTGTPTTWAWDFDNDGDIDSITQNPQFTYTTAGSYSVSLTVSNDAGGDTELKTSYVTVTRVVPPVTGVPVADFTANPTSGTAPLIVQFTDLSTGNPDQWNWDFNNDGFIDSWSRNPVATFRDPGDYTVRLWVYNSFGGDGEVKSMYIHVTGAAPAFPADLDFLGLAKFVRQFIPL